MNRRQFLQSSALAAAAASTQALAAEAPPAPSREYYELRLYHLRRGPMQKRFDDFYKNAAIPAMNRAGIKPVGVFSVLIGPDTPTMYVLLPHASIEAFAESDERVHADPEYQKAGAEFAGATPTDPSYVRVESSLMVAFRSMPKLEAPTPPGKTRIFELRTYESSSKRASKKKIEMFNTAEIAIFHRIGLTPVFFGETLVGAKMPNLTYMLVFENMADREKLWSAFGADPEWKKLSTASGNTDGEIVSNITNVLLRPTSFSQI